jgi:hypothetical protein
LLLDELHADETRNEQRGRGADHPVLYVGRVLRLTLLAPDIVEAILGGWQPVRLQLKDLLKRFPAGWQEQRAQMFDPN